MWSDRRLHMRHGYSPPAAHSKLSYLCPMLVPRHVVFIGDSMGATAALLFSHLATEVHAWTPQVDLATSSIR